VGGSAAIRPRRVADWRHGARLRGGPASPDECARIYNYIFDIAWAGCISFFFFFRPDWFVRTAVLPFMGALYLGFVLAKEKKK